MIVARRYSSAAVRGAAASFLFFQSGLAEIPSDWSWRLHGHAVHEPAFSPDGRQIAFSLEKLTRVGRDIHNLTAAQASAHIAQVEQAMRQDPRVFDPVVTIMTPATGAMARVGFGREPAFSPDGRSLVFQLQKQPISGLRALSSTLAGNEIWLHDRASGKSRMLAAPDSGSLGQPRFAPDGRSVVFTFNDSVNGAWSGAVGIGRVHLDSGSMATLYAPRKSHGLPHIVAESGFVDGNLLAVVMIPQQSGRFTANSYLLQLLALDHGEVVRFSWGIRDAFDTGFGFSSWRDGRIAVFDSAWMPIGSRRENPAMAGAARGWQSARGVMSPDGRMIAREFASGVVVTETVSGRRIAEFPGPYSHDQDHRNRAEQDAGEMLAGITWSHDSRRIAWVETIGYSTWDHETLRVATLPPRDDEARN